MQLISQLLNFKRHKCAIVDSNGTITAVGLGNAAITVTTHDGGYTATCDVVVIIKQYVVIIANANSQL